MAYCGKEMDMTENARDWIVGLAMAALTVLAMGYADAVADWLL